MSTHVRSSMYGIRFTDWYNVVEWTSNSPREVLALLIKAGDFETAKSWCNLQKLSEDIKLVMYFF